MDLFNQSGAEFSLCRQYRYLLWRTWDIDKPKVTFIMLNPSTADEVKNDPTVERCQRRAVTMGFGLMDVVNIFAFRSTNPKRLLEVEDPVGPANDLWIQSSVFGSQLVVCGWGKDGKIKGRGEEVLKLVRGRGVLPTALKINGDGTPAHPLYLPYDLRPVVML